MISQSFYIYVLIIIIHFFQHTPFSPHSGIPQSQLSFQCLFTASGKVQYSAESSWYMTSIAQG
jgi:hypothetical protein